MVVLLNRMFRCCSSQCRRSKRRRRQLKRRVYLFGSLVVFVVYQQSQMSAFRAATKYLGGYNQSVDAPKTLTANQVILRDANGAIVSRNTTVFSNYLTSNSKSTVLPSTMEVEQAKKDREPILAILRDAGISDVQPDEIMALPTWAQVETLYGPEPVFVGLEQCKAFQKKIPRIEDRFLGVAGMFNSGSTAFGISLQANCKYSNHPNNKSNHVLTDSNGMLDQVPWAKHKMATEKYNHIIHSGIPKEHVLPIVMVRDPYYWMHSMCKQGYGARWDHDSDTHCPNLVPNDYDRKRFKRLQNTSSVPVWMGVNRKVGPSWPSLVHYWNAWYQSYVHAEFPHLIIRFEDTLFHGRQVMKQVCECGGGQLVSRDHHYYLLDEAKWHHRHAQNNMISAILKYGSDVGRYRNMTKEDLEFAQKHLDDSLLDLFGYQRASL